MTSCHYIHCFIMYISKQFMSSSNILVKTMTETNTINTRRNEWIVMSIKILFQQWESSWLVCGIICDNWTMQWPRNSGGTGHIFESSNKNSVNVTENNDSIRILKWDGINEFITLNFLPNSLDDCQIVFLANPFCIHQWLLSFHQDVVD
jgi:hypothetical protein